MTTNSPSVIEKTANRPKLSLQCKGIGPNTTTIRSLDWERSRFDIEFGLRNGTTYNSFIIQGEKTALIDTSHAKFQGLWLKVLEETIDPKTIDYLIVSHTEPDHSGLISNILDLNNEIEIYGSKVALQFLENQVHRSFKSTAIKTGNTLELGKNPSNGINHNLEFISAPNLHWPDTIFSFDHGTKILYTCDAFGLHYCTDELYDLNPELINEDFRYYYDCLMGPNARSVLQALKRIKSLPEINTIAVGHGPLLHHNIELWLNNYHSWSSQRNTADGYVAICYISQYGFCDQLSQAIALGANKAEAQVQLVDIRSSDSQELSALIGDAKAVILPTWPNEADEELQSSIGTLLAALKQKQWIGVYESFGESDEPIDVIANQLRGLGQKEAFSPLRIKKSPDANTFQRFEEAGTDLGQILNRKKNIATIKSLDGDLVKALGRISGGLYVVTASQGKGKDKRRGAMIASWVSQASFSPPGLTVAVAKDRAIESLMQVGDRFVLNVLEENNYQKLFRQFLKRFPPGADRFEGIPIIDNIAQGGPVLSEGLAYLDCLVKQRLETTDHWIIYGVVEHGNISNSEAKTAVHHRKAGTSY
ncbi:MULTISPECIES: diflavin flavoprotein [unclassified Prochlorococcus]|uniref:diflavin flavoprotein n=1 Tax=unclassified Prochlorococcus TaxID=2627481 RepID=UPI000533955F|nr:MULTISPECIES: diflavin flavoprotein [unclassified Prochlorococcus]KGG16906.1 Diflavin flavoprotein [Prochlorococcus sp. MIT 0602]KGG18119.1 Diflavin flavoprotein [Prochlorococcus sp. MIT 0603]